MTDKELLDCLTDRPCVVCKFHKEKGCTKWDCVFEQRKQKPKTGHWIPKTQYTAICSICNHLQGTNGADLTGKALVHKALFKYCPNCGAKMESEVKDD